MSTHNSTLDLPLWADVGDSSYAEFDFLPLVDNSLFEETSSLDGKPSVETTPPSADEEATRPRRRKRVNALQVAIVSLHEDKAELERQLAALEARYAARQMSMTTCELKWEQIARNQLQLKLKAVRENDELRARLAAQGQLQEQLEHLVWKKPRLLMMQIEDDAWRVLKLSADGEARLTAIHAIADRQLESIESDMLTHGLMADDGDVATARVDTSSPEWFAQGVRSMHVADSSLDAAMMAAWETLLRVQGRSKDPSLRRTVHTYTIDADTVYVRSCYDTSGASSVDAVKMNVVLKRQWRNGRDDDVAAQKHSVARIVYRTILEDAAHPWDASSYSTDEYGWVHLETCVDGGVRYKSFARVNFRRPAKQDDEAVLAAMLGAMYLGSGVPMQPHELVEQVFRTAWQDFEALFRGALDHGMAAHD
ncbi:Aste57867_3184 [Aphanomyces stellatus]|uniref:Aste57867_3184 protein n=1 Tax=Aphanomyces stellatus TaxID=120398 RepID=A0A485KAV2_9STRA|nr:hypothetical protein As57867_003175 [Aphanomyces stellatus]VFT80358.1 Aste57867_3184 [Aphanomyces stellatus]